MTRLLTAIAILTWTSVAAAESPTDGPSTTKSVRLRLALGTGFHVRQLRRGDDGLAQLDATGQQPPVVFGQALAQLDIAVADPLRIGVAGGTSWRTSDRASSLVPRRIESHWRYGYAEALVVLGKRRRVGRVTSDLGARLSLGGGTTTWTQDGETTRAPLVRTSLAFEGVFLFRYGVGLGVRAGYALARSGAMGPADVFFDYSGLFIDFGFAMELAR